MKSEISNLDVIDFHLDKNIIDRNLHIDTSYQPKLAQLNDDTNTAGVNFKWSINMNTEEGGSALKVLAEDAFKIQKSNFTKEDLKVTILDSFEKVKQEIKHRGNGYLPKDFDFDIPNLESSVTGLYNDIKAL
jgi:hypothetical protein